MDNILNVQEDLKSTNIPQVDKEKLLRMTYDEKIKYTDKLCIGYPKMYDIISKVMECHESVKHFKRPKCMSIIGPTGAGKTTFYDIHLAKYPKVETPTGTELPVLYSRIPCPARIGNLAPKILDDMDDPLYKNRSTIALQTQRLYELIRDCKVQIIFLDEVQHLVDRNSERLIKDSSDWFKELIDEVKIPVIFMGLPESRKIFTENEQLGIRVRLREEVGPFKYTGDTYRKILYLFDIRLPLKNYSGLATPDTSMRIYLATKGLMKHIHDLITECTTMALNNNSPSITMPILAKAYEKLFYSKLDKNPFSPGFDLDSAMEKHLNYE